MGDDTRLSRFRGLITQDQMLSVTVIGCGGIGSAVIKQLAQLGVPKIIMWDGDTVDEVNRGTQGFSSFAVGKSKVEAMSDVCKAYGDEECSYIGINKFFKPMEDSITTQVAIIVPDSIDVRREIFKESIMDKSVMFLIDARMAAEQGQVFLVDMADKKQVRFYGESFFDSSEAMEESCTARATIYCGEFIASLIVSQYKAFCVSQIVPYRIDFHLRTLTMSVSHLLKE